jgi:HK97 family phage major capsid protein
MTVPELLQKRAKLGNDARAILEHARNEGRGLNAEETIKYDAIDADMKGINSLVSREREMTAATAELGAAEETRAVPGNGAAATRGGKQLTGLEARSARWQELRSTDEYREAFVGFLRHGKELGDDQRRLLDEVRAASPLSDVTGTAGAYTIPQGFYATLTDAMKWFGGIRQSNATIIRTATGNTLPFPTDNDTGNTGELLAENTAATQASTEMAFGVVNLAAYKYSSKIVLVPIELLQDSAFDIGAFVAKKLGQRIGRINNTHFTTGTGSGQPKGLVTAATVGITGATGQTLKVILADLINLIHKVDPAYRAGAQWMYNDATAAVVEGMVDGNGRPLLNSSLSGIAAEVAGGSVSQKKYLLGYEVVINNDMAVMAANAKSMAFGDISTYFVRDVMDIQLIRFQEVYMASGQVGFLAFSRSDANQIDAGMHPIQLYVNSAT